MPTLEDIREEIEKKAKVAGTYGGAFEVVPRIPTGIFPLDLAIGGGLPRGRITEVFGPEGSGKTNMVLKTISEAQKLEDRKQAFIDMEGTWDPHWATAMGVDVKRVYVIRPDFAEQASDLMAGLITADDVNLVALDSLAGMGTVKEVSEDSEKALYADGAKIIKRMTQKTVVAMNRWRNSGKPAPAVVWINQIRSNLAAGPYGNPESTPGGHSPKFAYSLRLRTYSKAKMDNSISSVLPIARTVTVAVKKYKVPITQMNCEYELTTLNHGDLKIGEVDDWHTVEKMLRAMAVLDKTKKGAWTMFGTEYPTLKAARATYRQEHALRMTIQKAIIEHAINESGFVQGDDEEEKFDPVTGELLGDK